MNITELARKLKITPQELRNWLPQIGFHIGQKAIKINRSEANKIIKEWPKLKRKIDDLKMAEEDAEKKDLEKPTVQKTLKIPNLITVKELSIQADIPVNKILTELMKNGIFTSINEKIDFDTAWLVGSELGLEITKKDENNEEKKKDELKEILSNEKESDLKGRPPVIVVMGHVDHGKTKLLDAIRRTNVIGGEAGGITQHIGAYQVVRRNKLITFIDTPGHEAFTAMRSRGAKIADIAILVVAADDGVKPQTVEAFRIIESAKIPYVVAINKIDKPEANIDKTKQELSSKLNIIPEDWGGKSICAPISAIDGTGINDLLDMVLLVADTEEDNIKANPDSDAAGTVIESNIDKGAGPVATILIQNGTIKIGDLLTLDNINIGKVRCLKDYLGKDIQEAGPATPVQILGLKVQPQVGDIVKIGIGEKIKLKKFKSSNLRQTSSSAESQNEDEKIKKINLIIKSDVLGSAEAIDESLEKINTKKITTKILHKGLGNITDGDLKRAEASNAKIIGFNVKTPPVMAELAREKNITIKHYNIIYDLINDIKAEMEELIEPEFEMKEIGKMKILAIFRTGKKNQIVGGKVIEGKIIKDAVAEVYREDELIAEGTLSKVQLGKQEVNEAEADNDCGVQFEGKPLIQEGDTIKVLREEKIISTLE